MPKPRRKKKPKGNPPELAAECRGFGPADATAEVTGDFVHVPTPDLVVIEDLEGVTNLDVAGRFVKVAPKIRASQRDAFDGPGIMAQLREAGALSVVLAPVFLAETQKDAELVTTAMNDRDAVRAWFEAQTAGDPDSLKAAEELVLDYMDAEGM